MNVTLRARTSRKRLPRGKYDRSKSTVDRKGEQRQRLLAAATDVFADVGYAKASVAAVLECSGLSRATFYEHFRDLEALFAAVYESAVEGTRRLQQKELDRQSDPAARLEGAVRAHYQRIGANPAVAKAINREVYAAGRELVLRREVGVSELAGLLMEGLSRAHSAGVIRREPDELTCYGLVHAIEAIGMRYVVRGDTTHIEEAVPVAVRMVLGTFGADVDEVGDKS